MFSIGLSLINDNFTMVSIIKSTFKEWNCMILSIATSDKSGVAQISH